MKSLTLCVVLSVVVFAGACSGGGADVSTEGASEPPEAAASVLSGTEQCEEFFELVDAPVTDRGQRYRELAVLMPSTLAERAERVASIADEMEQRWPGSTSEDLIEAEAAVPDGDREEFAQLQIDVSEDMVAVSGWLTESCAEERIERNMQQLIDGENGG